MTKEEFKAIMQSLGRIEFLLKIILEAKYGRTEANRVYGEIVDIIDKELFKEVTNNAEN